MPFYHSFPFGASAKWPIFDLAWGQYLGIGPVRGLLPSPRNSHSPLVFASALSSARHPLHCLWGVLVGYLDKYSRAGSQAEPRSFAFKADLRTIIERDHGELSLILLPRGAWKSRGGMAGRILEAILFDVLGKDNATKSQASSNAKASRRGYYVGPLRHHQMAVQCSGCRAACRHVRYRQQLREQQPMTST